MGWREGLGANRRVAFGIVAALVVLGALALVIRSGGGDGRSQLRAGGDSASSSSSSGGTTSTSVTAPDLSTSTLPSDSGVPATLPTATTAHLATTVPATTEPPPTAPPTTTVPPGPGPGYARIEIVNSLGRTVYVRLESDGAINVTLAAGASRPASDMAVSDAHGAAGNVNPPGEQCGSGGVGDYFAEGHRYRVTVTNWDGEAEGAPCAAEPTPMLIVRDLDTGVTKTIGSPNF